MVGLMLILSSIIAGGSYLLDGPMWLTTIATVVCLVSFLGIIVRVKEASSLTEGIADAFTDFPDIGGDSDGGGYDGGYDGGGDSGGDGGGGGD